MLTVGTICSVQLLFDFLGVYCLLNHHVRITVATGGHPTLFDLTGTFTQGLFTTLFPMVAASWCVRASKAYDVTDPSGAQIEYYSGPTVCSDSEEDGLPPFMCFFTKVYSAEHGKKNGYHHVSGVPMSAVLDGQLDPAFLSRTVGYETYLSTPHSHFLGQSEFVIYRRPSAVLPLGGFSAIKKVQTMRLSTQVSRDGRGNTDLLAQFGL